MGALLIVLGAAGVSFVGVGLWVVFRHFFTADIPAAISHPVKLRVLDCLLQLLLMWVSLMFYLSPCGEGLGERWEHLQKLLVALTLT